MLRMSGSAVVKHYFSFLSYVPANYYPGPRGFLLFFIGKLIKKYNIKKKASGTRVANYKPEFFIGRSIYGTTTGHVHSCLVY